MQFFDTHCHIQFPDYPLEAKQVYAAAHVAGVTKMLCVGCRLDDSQAAIAFADQYDSIWASIGLHPHEALHYVDDNEKLQQFRNLARAKKVVAIGEIGLDYYYEHSPKLSQQKLLRLQLDIAKEHNLPVIFHVRDAFDDFWKIFDAYQGIRGVVHSFSATEKELTKILERGLLVGLNGIMTFTRDPAQLKAAQKVPLDRLLLETDAPFLTPVPFRGTICEPRHVVETATFLATIRGEKLEVLAAATTKNAQDLFRI